MVSAGAILVLTTGGTIDKQDHRPRRGACTRSLLARQSRLAAESAACPGGAARKQLSGASAREHEMKMRKFEWKYRYNILSVLFITWGVAVLDRMAMPVALPYIAKEFGLTPFQTSLILSTFFIGYALAHLPGGVLADKIGVRKVATIALVWWSAFTALTGAAANLVQLLFVRLAFGLGEGAFPAASFKTVATWFPTKERATAAAVMFTANSIGTALSPLIVVAIMAAWGWRAVFYILFIPGIVASILFWRVIRNNPAEARGITADELKEIEAGESDADSGVDRKGKLRDVLQPDMLKYFFSFLIFDIAYWGFQSWLPTYLVHARGFSMMEMGAAASLPFLVGAFGRVAGGWLSDNVFRNSRRSLVAATQLLSGLFLVLTFVSPTTWALIVSQTIAGFFLSVFQSAFWALPMSSIPRSKMGVATGFINMGGQIGGLISPLCIGALLELSNGDFAAAGIFLEATILASLIIVLTLPARVQVSSRNI